MKHPFIESVERALVMLREECGRFQQTTHGSILASGCDISYVCNALVNAVINPKSYTISELAQAIDGYLDKP